MFQNPAVLIGVLCGFTAIFLSCYVLARVPRHVREFWRDKALRDADNYGC